MLRNALLARDWRLSAWRQNARTKTDFLTLSTHMESVETLFRAF